MFQTSYLLNNILFNEIAVKILSSSLSWDKPFNQVSSSSLDLNPEIEQYVMDEIIEFFWKGRADITTTTLDPHQTHLEPNTAYDIHHTTVLSVLCLLFAIQSYL